MGWYFFKDTQFRRTKGVHTTFTGISRLDNEEIALRSIFQRYSWRRAHLLGLSLTILALLIFSHGMSLHQMNPDSTVWSIVIPSRFDIMLWIVLKSAGFFICTEWYLFRDIRIENAEET